MTRKRFQRKDTKRQRRSARFPLTQGETLEEVIAMAKEAIEGFIECLAAHGDPIPVEKTHSRLSVLNIQVKAPARV